RAVDERYSRRTRKGHELAAERAVAQTTNVVAFTRKRPARQPFPEHLPRERVIEPGPTVCLCCGSPRRRKLGEDITETLEVIPRQWKVIQHIREKFTCRDCEKDALFEIERSINGQSIERRQQARQELSALLIADLEGWLHEHRPKLSRGN